MWLVGYRFKTAFLSKKCTIRQQQKISNDKKPKEIKRTSFVVEAVSTGRGGLLFKRRIVLHTYEAIVIRKLVNGCFVTTIIPHKITTPDKRLTFPEV